MRSTEPRVEPGQVGSSTAGFEFIVTTPSQRRNQDHQRLIKSHVSRGRTRRKGAPGLPSWISQDVEEQSQQRRDPSTSMIPSPNRASSGPSWRQFPEPMEPYMLEDLVRFLEVVKDALYPTEICLSEGSVSASWVGGVMSDPVLFNSMLFAAEAYFDICLGRDRSLTTQFHFLKTLRLLQERICTPALAVSDKTMMTVVTLALAAEVLGDFASVENHLEGLQRMVRLRGGLGALGSDIRDISAKICRVDLNLAIRCGRRPTFFRQAISWDPYLSGHKAARHASSSTNAELESFIQALDKKLAIVWTDLHQFSEICNLAFQTEYKLPQQTFNEIMISILYRLLHLSLENSLLEDALRAGMAVYASKIFFRWKFLHHKEDHLLGVFNDALRKLRHSSVDIPPLVIFWLLMVWNISVSTAASEKRYAAWFGEATTLLAVSSWDEARKLLKSMIWIDLVDDSKGEAAFNSALVTRQALST